MVRVFTAWSRDLEWMRSSKVYALGISRASRVRRSHRDLIGPRLQRGNSSGKTTQLQAVLLLHSTNTSLLTTSPSATLQHVRIAIFSPCHSPTHRLSSPLPRTPSSHLCIYFLRNRPSQRLSIPPRSRTCSFEHTLRYLSLSEAHRWRWRRSWAEETAA